MALHEKISGGLSYVLVELEKSVSGHGFGSGRIGLRSESPRGMHSLRLFRA
jgi:hypothetical protein